MTPQLFFEYPYKLRKTDFITKKNTKARETLFGNNKIDKETNFKTFP